MTGLPPVESQAEPSPVESASPTSPSIPSTGSNGSSQRSITSDELLQGCRELLIQHAGETYRLRLTRNGKLILNK